MRTLLVACVAVLVTGCASFRATQLDQRENDTTTVKTEIKGWAFFASAQKIAGIAAKQTQATQAFNADVMEQGGGTNVVAMLNALARIVESVRP